MTSVETVWDDNFKEREAVFKKMIDSWDIDQWAKVIKSIYLNKFTAKPRNKLRSYPVSDDKLLLKAEHYFNQELAHALNIGEFDVPKYIESVLQNKQQSER